jgi:hypothetical protein
VNADADLMRESVVEVKLKVLERFGFKVLKLRTPGYNGVMDRMILWPTYAPRPPSFVELKRPGKEPRLLQIAVANEWRRRGCDVREYCDTIEKVEALVSKLIIEVERYRVRHAAD